jgi:hypothetical protein
MDKESKGSKSSSTQETIANFVTAQTGSSLAFPSTGA